MKTIKLILGVILILIVLGIVGNYAIGTDEYVPTKNDVIYGTWVNEEMGYEKIIITTDSTRELYHYLNQKLPTAIDTFTIDDSWVDENGNKFFKVHLIPKGKPEVYVYAIWKINKSGDVLELNRYIDWESRKGDPKDPKKYPAEVNPDDLGSLYYIYYRQ